MILFWCSSVVYKRRLWDSMKNSLFSSNKTPKIANKPTKSMKNAETVRTRTPLKSLKKSEVSVSYNMEFKLKYYRKSSKIP